jgi:Fur family transcriptional regulator, ferric uptake regulator
VEALVHAGHHATRSRVAVAELVSDRVGHFTAADVARLATARGARMGRATVFRTLELFAELGVVERLDLPGGDHAYVACTPDHHHHVVCSRCGRAAWVSDIGMTDVMHRVADRTGYRIERHRVELYGVCPPCQAGERVS